MYPKKPSTKKPMSTKPGSQPSPTVPPVPLKESMARRLAKSK